MKYTVLALIALLCVSVVYAYETNEQIDKIIDCAAEFDYTCDEDDNEQQKLCKEEYQKVHKCETDCDGNQMETSFYQRGVCIDQKCLTTKFPKMKKALQGIAKCYTLYPEDKNNNNEEEGENEGDENNENENEGSKDEGEGENQVEIDHKGEGDNKGEQDNKGEPGNKGETNNKGQEENKGQDTNQDNGNNKEDGGNKDEGEKIKDEDNKEQGSNNNNQQEGSNNNGQKDQNGQKDKNDKIVKAEQSVISSGKSLLFAVSLTILAILY